MELRRLEMTKLPAVGLIIVILFSFSNLVASFQGYVNKILLEKLNVFIIVYLDDILIYTKDQGHVKAV